MPVQFAEIALRRELAETREGRAAAGRPSLRVAGTPTATSPGGLRRRGRRLGGPGALVARRRPLAADLQGDPGEPDPAVRLLDVAVGLMPARQSGYVPQSVRQPAPALDEGVGYMEILSVRGVLPEHTYAQQEITDAFAEVIADGGLDESLLRLPANAGVAGAASSSTRGVRRARRVHRGQRPLHHPRRGAGGPGRRRRPQGVVSPRRTSTRSCRPP